MKLIEILLTEVFDNPYPLSKPTASFYSNNPPRYYISEFFSKDDNIYRVQIKEDRNSQKDKPTFELGFNVCVDSKTSDLVKVGDRVTKDGIEVNKKTGNEVFYAYSKRTDSSDTRVLSSVIQHVKKFKKIADRLTSMNQGYAIIFTPSPEQKIGTDGSAEITVGSAEKLGKLYDLIINKLKGDTDFEGVEFTESALGYHQANFNGYEGEYKHKEPSSGLKKPISKIEDKIDDKIIDPLADRMIDKMDNDEE